MSNSKNAVISKITTNGVSGFSSPIIFDITDQEYASVHKTDITTTTTLGGTDKLIITPEQQSCSADKALFKTYRLISPPDETFYLSVSTGAENYLLTKDHLIALIKGENDNNSFLNNNPGGSATFSTNALIITEKNTSDNNVHITTIGNPTVDSTTVSSEASAQTAILNNKYLIRDGSNIKDIGELKAELPSEDYQILNSYPLGKDAEVVFVSKATDGTNDFYKFDIYFVDSLDAPGISSTINKVFANGSTPNDSLVTLDGTAVLDFKWKDNDTSQLSINSKSSVSEVLKSLDYPQLTIYGPDGAQLSVYTADKNVIADSSDLNKYKTDIETKVSLIDAGSNSVTLTFS